MGVLNLVHDVESVLNLILNVVDSIPRSIPSMFQSLNQVSFGIRVRGLATIFCDHPGSRPWGHHHRSIPIFDQELGAKTY